MKEQNNMHSYLIESLAPLVFRSGKPFGSQASAQDVIFPLPSVAAGLVRYLHLSQKSENSEVLQFKLTEAKDKEKLTKYLHSGNHPEVSDNIFQKFQSYKRVLNIHSYGSFLVKFSNENNIQILAPKPANALYLNEKDDNHQLTGKTLLVRLEPRAFYGENELCGSDLPDGLLHIQIEPKFEHQKGKPAKRANFWTLEHFIQWQKGENLDFDTVNDNGLTSIPTELRTHIAIDDEHLTSADGKLFQTASFDLAHQKIKNGWEKERLGFLIQTTQKLTQDLVTFGGERRLSHFKIINQPNVFYQPQDDINNINQIKGFSLAFITPCIFQNGSLPNWIDKKTLLGKIPNTDIQVQLKAMAIDRWQAVSGWDTVLWKPKATRKAISAGSVYWFKIISGELTPEILDKLKHNVWSDNDYDRCDGFGSAILSAWQAPN